MSTYPGPEQPAPGQPIYIPVPMQQRPSVLARLFTLLQWLAFGFFMLVVVTMMYAPSTLSSDPDNKLEERYVSLAKDGVNKVAIIEIDGTIMDGKEVKKQIDKIRADDAVKALVLRIDSPGGTVTGSDYIYHHVKQLVADRKLPIVVSMGALAASGGYYSAMACGKQDDVIYAEPTTWTGSIGVIIPHYSVAGLMDKLAIEDDSIKSAPLKGVGSPTKPMTPEERQVLETLVKESFERFKSIVKSGRPKLTDDQMKKATTGQVFTTKQALELGLVDKEGFLEDAVERSLQLASLDKATTKVVKYHKPTTVVDALLGASAAVSQPNQLQQLLDLSTPRAYYLFAFPQR